MPSLNLDPTALFEEALIDLAQYTAVGSLCSSVSMNWKRRKKIRQLQLNYIILGIFCILYFYNVFMCLQILFELLAKGGTVKELIQKKDLVQVSCRINRCLNFYHVVCLSQNSARDNLIL